jgi:hypothetical protein
MLLAFRTPVKHDIDAKLEAELNGEPSRAGSTHA